MSTMTGRTKPTAPVTHASGVPTEVLVIGAGPAGCAAAIAAAGHGARVTVIDAGPRAAPWDAGREWCYLGGGTATQRHAGVVDSAREMYAYLLAISCQPDRPRLQEYCARSVEHHDWLVGLGLRFGQLPQDLVTGGNELVWPFRSMARPAARGHLVVSSDGSAAPSRAVLDLLRSHLDDPRIRIAYGTRADRVHPSVDGGPVLVHATELSGRAEVRFEADAVVIATGRSAGHRLAGTAGAHVVNDEQELVEPLFATTPAMARGVIVNSDGVRFVAEDSTPSRLAYLTALQPAGAAYLVLDQGLSAGQPSPPVLGTWNSLSAVEVAIDLPAGSLETTLDRYSSCVRQGEDPDLHKLPSQLATLSSPPWTVYDLRRGPGTHASSSLAGIRTSLDGNVLDAHGSPVAGVLAAGTGTLGITIDGETHCVGLDLGEATYFARRAGATASRTGTTWPAATSPAATSTGTTQARLTSSRSTGDSRCLTP